MSEGSRRVHIDEITSIWMIVISEIEYAICAKAKEYLIENVSMQS